MRRLASDFSLSAVAAGLIAVLVGYSSSVAIVFQAAKAVGATPAQTTSWLWALGIGMGVTCIGFALWFRRPVLTAWSTPGAALIASSHGLTIHQAIGAFVLSGALTVIVGATGLFARVMNRIPLALAAALLAGVLVRFGLDAATASASAPWIVVPMAAAYVAARLLIPRYAVLAVLAVGTLAALIDGTLSFSQVDISAARPEWTTPSFTIAAAIGLAVPLFIVTMASQNLPGVAVIRANGYEAPVSEAVTGTGVATVALAPFGGFAFNLAAISAAICAGPHAHHDPEKRYTAVVAAGVFYTVMGLLGGAVVGLLAAFPVELVEALAGLALVGTIATALATSFAEERMRDAAAITFLVTLSGVETAGIGSAFWGIVAGAVALSAQRLVRR
ncbi:MAG: benzoate/H(+) symporter BenE family transporter [Actinobacteria bacterium]|nr:benzoate/H(+) symporter BenE family transporter [Actinomycetota bacterium]